MGTPLTCVRDNACRHAARFCLARETHIFCVAKKTTKLVYLTVRNYAYDPDLRQGLEGRKLRSNGA